MRGWVINCSVNGVYICNKILILVNHGQQMQLYRISCWTRASILSRFRIDINIPLLTVIMAFMASIVVCACAGCVNGFIAEISVIEIRLIRGQF